MKTFEIEIIAPENVIFKGIAKSLVLPAFEGKLGVLAGHIPLVAQIMPGEIRIVPDHPFEGRDTVYLAVSGGFAEVMQKRVRLFVETAELADEINAERARLALERAKQQIKEGPDIRQAQAAMQRALTRIRVSEKGRPAVAGLQKARPRKIKKTV